MRVDVFNGWVELRDPEQVSERLRRPVFEKSIEAANLNTDGDQLDPVAMRFFSEFNDLLAVALVAEWSFNLPITVDGLQDLPSKSYDDVRKAVTPFMSSLIPDFGIDVDPKATTDS